MRLQCIIHWHREVRVSASNHFPEQWVIDPTERDPLYEFNAQTATRKSKPNFLSRLSKLLDTSTWPSAESETLFRCSPARPGRGDSRNTSTRAKHALLSGFSLSPRPCAARKSHPSPERRRRRQRDAHCNPNSHRALYLSPADLMGASASPAADGLDGTRPNGGRSRHQTARDLHCH
jgi:hypothetical protein